MKIGFIFSAILFGIFAQVQNDSVSTALNKFAINFLAETNKIAGPSLNVAVSPYTVWNVLAIINEGASKNTEIQLQQALGIPEKGPKRDEFRTLQRNLTRNILKDYDGISLEVLNAIFTRTEKRLNRDYQSLVKMLYDVDVSPLDFNDVSAASNTINKKLYDATNGRLNNIVKDEDIMSAQMFVTSALFFKGHWENQFNLSATKYKTFYNEDNQDVGKIQMMFSTGVFAFTTVLNDKATAIVLPYKGGHMSMIAILPKINVKLQTVLDLMKQTPFSSVVNALKESLVMFPTDTISVFLPKFKIESDFSLNYVLHLLGIEDVINAGLADLSNISPDSLYLSNIIHKAQIIVDEEGTEASAATIGELDNKNIPAVFEANRPYIYFIYDKQTDAIVFAGRLITPTV